MRNQLNNLARNWQEATTWLVVLVLLFIALAILAYVIGMTALQRMAPSYATFWYALMAGAGGIVLVTGTCLGVARVCRTTRSR